MATIYGHKMAVAPSACSGAASCSSAEMSGTPFSVRNAGLPIRTRRPAMVPATPPAVVDWKSVAASSGKLPFAGGLDDRMCQRVFAALLERSGKAKEVGLGEAVSGQDFRQPGFALSECAGFVHGQRVQAGERFDGLGVADEHAPFVRRAQRQPSRTWAWQAPARRDRR